MRRLAFAAALAVIVAAPSGCGGKFVLPTEHRGALPGSGTYEVVATWKGMDDVQDLFITQGQGDQLFVLFNHGGDTGPSVPRGEVIQYKLKSTFPSPLPILLHPLATLFNPIGITATRKNLFVLDQGDSCRAKFDLRRGTCEADRDTTHATGHPFRSQIFDYTATWRVREYDIQGGETLSTFTDTTVAQPFGIAVDDQDRVYVSSIAVFLDSSQTDKRIRTRKFVSRIYRYLRGPKYAGGVLDVNMPGTASWHRDTTWRVLDGSGLSSVADPRGIYWSPAGSNPLFIADRGNNAAKAVSSVLDTLPVVKVDGQETGAIFNHPEAVVADLGGSFFVVDRDNRRVLRFGLSGQFQQRVDLEPNGDGLPLLDPVSVAVADTLAYVADRGRGQVVRYSRRQ